LLKDYIIQRLKSRSLYVPSQRPSALPAKVSAILLNKQQYLTATQKTAIFVLAVVRTSRKENI
jgi:hypothetical protein